MTPSSPTIPTKPQELIKLPHPRQLVKLQHPQQLRMNITMVGMVTMAKPLIRVTRLASSTGEQSKQ